MSKVMCNRCGERGVYVTETAVVRQREWWVGYVSSGRFGLEFVHDYVDDSEELDRIETESQDEAECAGCGRSVFMDDLGESHFALPDDCWGEVEFDIVSRHEGAVIAHYDEGAGRCPALHPVPAVYWDEETQKYVDDPDETEQREAEQVAETVQTKPADGLAELLRDVTDPL